MGRAVYRDIGDGEHPAHRSRLFLPRPPPGIPGGAQSVSRQPLSCRRPGSSRTSASASSASARFIRSARSAMPRRTTSIGPWSGCETTSRTISPITSRKASRRAGTLSRPRRRGREMRACGPLRAGRPRSQGRHPYAEPNAIEAGLGCAAEDWRWSLEARASRCAVQVHGRRCVKSKDWSGEAIERGWMRTGRGTSTASRTRN